MTQATRTHRRPRKTRYDFSRRPREKRGAKIPAGSVPEFRTLSSPIVRFVRHTSTMALDRLKRNELYHAVSAEGLTMTDVKLEPKVSRSDERGLQYEYDSCTINHIPSGSKVTLDDLSGRPVAFRRSSSEQTNYRIIALVPESAQVRWRTERSVWNDAIKDVSDWARTVRDVTDNPDLWANLDWAREYIKLYATQHVNAPFSIAEQELISVRLRQIADSLGEVGKLTANQIRDIRETLDDLSEATARVGRKDWLLMFYGAILSLLVASLIPPDVVQQIMMPLIHVVAHMLQPSHDFPGIESH
jgi:hypothetical protein